MFVLQVLSHEAAAQSASLIFLCVHREHYDFLESLAPQLKEKVLCCTARWFIRTSQFVIFPSLNQIHWLSQNERCWLTWATIIRRTCTQRPMLSICRGEEKLNRRVTSCLLVHVVKTQEIAKHNGEVCCLLSRLIPGAHVVKAFNTLSAWALQNGPADASRQVTRGVSVCFKPAFSLMFSWSWFFLSVFIISIQNN